VTSQSNLFSKTYDVCEPRHGGNVESVKANPTDEDKQRGRDRILKLIEAAGVEGLNSAEIEKALGVGKNYFSGRLRELFNDGEVFRLPSRPERGRGEISVHKKFRAQVSY
jgi:hypothetical protein